jgi:hypothetical protein
MAIASDWIEREAWLDEADGSGMSAAWLIFLNLADGVFTTLFLHFALATEANPLMRMAWEGSPLLFMAVKLAAVQSGVSLLWLNRNAQVARLALKAGALVYGAVVLWHLSFLVRLAAQ